METPLDFESAARASRSETLPAISGAARLCRCSMFAAQSSVGADIDADIDADVGADIGADVGADAGAAFVIAVGNIATSASRKTF